MSDRRRINGPAAATQAPVYLPEPNSRPAQRTRAPNVIRPMFLKTGVTPTASGSAYLELSPPNTQYCQSQNGMKLICTVHGPRALPRSAPFSHHLVLSTHVKYAPFATRHRRGYVRDPSELDLSMHVETALRGALMASRWPKSGVDVTVTIIEGDERPEERRARGHEEWDWMTALGGCITVASAALADAGIDCVDMVTGGVAALVRRTTGGTDDGDDGDDKKTVVVLDPATSEHDEILASCCVAYLPSRDEITNVWVKGQLGTTAGGLEHMTLIGKAVQASRGTRKALTACLEESL